MDRATGEIAFERVSFAYDASRASVLRDVSFTIRAGQTVALVGKSGAGKSTLASLIARFYEPTSGRILLDGKPLDSYRLASLRRQVALVSQDVTLFNDTLAANIAYGGLAGAKREAIETAARRAHADEFIEAMPQGLDTVVGDDGVLLSGGQRQRVAIARALLKDAPVLILDEATSSLDAHSERHVQAALEAVMRGRTTILIAHRLSTVEKADAIAVVEDGVIVETGTHAELMAAGGAYADLYRSQFDNGEVVPRSETRARHSGGASRPGWPVRDAGGCVVQRPVLAASPAAARRCFRLAREASAPALFDGPQQGLAGACSCDRRGETSPRGGTGKTPLVIWLAEWLKGRGLAVGVVSRGYGGRASYPLVVEAETPAARCGDEAGMIARRTGCPVVVDPDRPRAARKLLEVAEVDVIVADDGLQHYALHRDVEIAVVDGARGVGNGHCLPAGPLREPACAAPRTAIGWSPTAPPRVWWPGSP